MCNAALPVLVGKFSITFGQPFIKINIFGRDEKRAQVIPLHENSSMSQAEIAEYVHLILISLEFALKFASAMLLI